MPTENRINTVSFLIFLLVVFIVVVFIAKPFVNLLAFAVITAILFSPVYNLLVRRVKNQSVASLLTIIIILAIIVIPLVFFGQVIYSQISNLFDKYRAGELVIDRSQLISDLPDQIQTIIQNFSQDFSNLVGRIYSQAFSSITGLLSNVANFVIAFFMFFFVVYYLLRDGDKIKEALSAVSPIGHNQESKLIDKVVSAVNGVVKGSFLVALVQGVVATIGFYIFGVPEPLLWGAFTVIAALVPTVGTSLSLIPAIIYLAVTGHVPQAIGMAIWGLFAVGMIDNFIGPRLIGGSVKLHPVLVLIAVIGGIQMFGLLGFLIGPIIMAVFVAMVEMYRIDFKDNLLK